MINCSAHTNARIHQMNLNMLRKYIEPGPRIQPLNSSILARGHTHTHIPVFWTQKSFGCIAFGIFKIYSFKMFHILLYTSNIETPCTLSPNDQTMETFFVFICSFSVGFANGKCIRLRISLHCLLSLFCLIYSVFIASGPLHRDFPYFFSNYFAIGCVLYDYMLSSLNLNLRREK